MPETNTIFSRLRPSSGLTFYLRERDGRNKESGPHQHRKLSEIQLRNEYSVEPAEDIAKALRQRIQIAKVHARYRHSAILHFLNGGGDRTVGRAPAHYQNAAARLAENLDIGYVVGYERDLFRPRQHHMHMVFGIV